MLEIDRGSAPPAEGKKKPAIALDLRFLKSGVSRIRTYDLIHVKDAR